MRRLQPLHAPTFLVDQYGGIRPARGLAEGCRQRPHLRRLDAVALEQDEAEWLLAGKKRLLFRRQGLLSTRRGTGAARKPIDGNSADDEKHSRGCPKCDRLGAQSWLQQHEFAVARDEIVDHLLVAIARRYPLAHQHTQILGKLGVGIVDGLVLTDHAAKLSGQVTGALLQLRVLQNLIGIDGEGWQGGEEKEEQQRKDPPLACRPSPPQGGRSLAAASSPDLGCESAAS